MDKKSIIKMLSEKSGKYGSLLIDLLEYCNKIGIKDVTEEECNEYIKNKNIKLN